MNKDFIAVFQRSKISNIGNFLILILGIIFLILNFNFMYIKHNTWGSLPVIIYVFYENSQVIPFYLLIFLSVINIITNLFVKIIKLRVLIYSIQSLIAFFSIILLFINPQFLILFPQGSTPTNLEYLEIGGYLYIISTLVFIGLTFHTLNRERYLKRYFQYTSLLIVALLLSSFIHENGHAFFVLISGGEITGYAPFPFLDWKNFAGYVNFQNVPDEFYILVMMGGEIFQWVFIFLVGFILYFKKFNFWVNRFLIFLMIIAWLDFPLYSINNTFGLPHWFIFGSKTGDIVIVSSTIGLDMLYFNILAITQLIIGALIIYFKVIRKRINLEIGIFHKKIQEIETNV